MNIKINNFQLLKKKFELESTSVTVYTRVHLSVHIVS
jgi:hypothetical protein